MKKEELANFFSENLVKGIPLYDVRQKALKLGYTPIEIEEALALIGIGRTSQKERSPYIERNHRLVITLSILIGIVALAIIIILLLNLFQPKTTTTTKTPARTDSIITQVTISSQIFNNSYIATSSGLEDYFLKYPQEKTNIELLNSRLKSCKKIKANFVSDPKTELDGSLYVEDIGGNKCLVSYNSDFALNCTHTKEQLILSYNDAKEKGIEAFYGPTIFLMDALYISMMKFSALLVDSLEQSFNNTGVNVNNSGKPDFMGRNQNLTFTNPLTNQNETIPCIFYEND